MSALWARIKHICPNCHERVWLAMWKVEPVYCSKDCYVEYTGHDDYAEVLGEG